LQVEKTLNISMADSFQKKEREKKRRKRKQEKKEKKLLNKSNEEKGPEFMYVDKFGNLTPTPPEYDADDEIKLEDIQVSTPKGNFRTVDMTNTGFVKFYKHEDGYGFIKDKVTQREYFFSGRDLEDEVKVNTVVIFEVGSGPKGPMAVNVKVKK